MKLHAPFGLRTELHVPLDLRLTLHRALQWNSKCHFSTRDSMFYLTLHDIGRSQWPRGLRHEMSSPARTLQSWVWIPLKASICISVSSVFVLPRVGSGLASGWYPDQGVLPTVYDYETEVKRSVSRMPYAPSGSNRDREIRYRAL
jgi:hypothetical protein